jgi:3-hydroxyacyl-[acyl-carrier-protein] dehydratase
MLFEREEGSLSVLEIQQLIPHRYPMLLVDRLEEIVPRESCVGVKNVTINEPFFTGHFPEQPIMPGVLIIEAMAQTAGTLVCYSLNLMGKKQSVYFMSIEDARFRKPVLPGDTLKMHVSCLQNRRNVWKFKGEAKVNEVTHAEATFTAMIAE